MRPLGNGMGRGTGMTPGISPRVTGFVQLQTDVTIISRHMTAAPKAVCETSWWLCVRRDPSWVGTEPGERNGVSRLPWWLLPLWPGAQTRRQARQDSKNRRSASRQVSSPRSSYWAAPKDSPRTSNCARERGSTDPLAPEGTQFPDLGGQLSQQQSPRPRLLSPFPESRAAQPASGQPSPPMGPTTHSATGAAT